MTFMLKTHGMYNHNYYLLMKNSDPRQDLVPILFFSKFNLELPILASYNVALNNKWNLRINAGPYLSYAMFGRDKSIDYAYGNGMHSSLGWWHQDFPDHFTYGGRAGVSLESEHFIYTIDGKCSLRKRPFGQSVSLSAGVGYKF